MHRNKSALFGLLFSTLALGAGCAPTSVGDETTGDAISGEVQGKTACEKAQDMVNAIEAIYKSPDLSALGDYLDDKISLKLADDYDEYEVDGAVALAALEDYVAAQKIRGYVNVHGYHYAPAATCATGWFMGDTRYDGAPSGYRQRFTTYLRAGKIDSISVVVNAPIGSGP